MTDVDDINILDNLQAEEQPGTDAKDSSAAPEDNPIYHVPEDQLRNLDTLEIAMPQVQEAADTAAHIAAEAISLKSRGRISALEAAELAAMVPAINGTENDPVSYTSVPTSVGVTAAVEILENAAGDARALAASKATDCITRAVQRTDSALSAFEATWVGCLASYMQAVDDLRRNAGGTPESDPHLYLGNEAAMDVLDVIFCSGMSSSAPHPRLGELHEQLKQATKAITEPTCLFQAPMCLRFGLKTYILDDLLTGCVDGSKNRNSNGSLSYGSFLAVPATHGTALSEILQSAARALSSKLEGLSTSISEGVTAQMPVADTAAQVAKAAETSAVLNLVLDSLDCLCGITQAATAFYKSYGTSDIPVIAAERNTMAIRKRKLF